MWLNCFNSWGFGIIVVRTILYINHINFTFLVYELSKNWDFGKAILNRNMTYLREHEICVSVIEKSWLTLTAFGYNAQTLLYILDNTCHH